MNDWDSQLLTAARNKNVVKMEECIDNGANVNCKGSPLHRAIYRGHLESVKLLVTRGADINDDSSGHVPPLIYALDKLTFPKPVVRYLVDKGANVCKVDTRGRTALSLAVQREDTEMIQLLLDHGAKYSVQTAFLDAIETEDMFIIRALRTRGLDVNATYKNGYTPLSKAVEVGKLATVEYLIEAGADVNKPDGRGVPLLVKSVEMGNLEMVKVLVKNGADLNASDQAGSSLFYKALRKERLAVVKYFVGRGENVDQLFENNERPLSIAASNSDFETFQFLVDSGADVGLALWKIQQVVKNNESFEFYFRSLQQKKSKEGVTGQEED